MTAVEFLIAWADHTWSTETHWVPCHDANDVDAVAWANANLAPLSRYGQVAMFAVYSYPQEE